MNKKIPTSAGIPCDLNFSYPVQIAKKISEFLTFLEYSIKSLRQFLPGDQRWIDLTEYSGSAPNSSA